MRIVTIEEHVSYPDLSATISRQKRETAGWVSPDQSPKAVSDSYGKLVESADERLAAMDAAGIDVQVLSFVGAGAELVRGRAGNDFAREVNTRLAKMVDTAPERFFAFAHLPVLDPEAAANELDYAATKLGMRGALIMGSIDGLFLDDPRFAPILETAAQLDLPLYLHPGIPPLAIRELYYERLPVPTSIQLSQAAYGWHAETAIHVLRLAASGTLTRYPSLQVVIGHMGETLPFMLARIDRQFSRDDDLIREPVSEILKRQLWVTTSGMFTRGPLDLLHAVLGTERTMFSVDYPFENLVEARTFLDSLQFAGAQLEDFSHGNADRLLRLFETAGDLWHVRQQRDC